MKTQQPPHIASPRPASFRKRMLVAVTALSLLPLPSNPALAGPAPNPEPAAALCRQFTGAVRNMRELAGRRDAIQAIQTCINLGVDPPLKARRDYGRAPSPNVATAQLPSRTCPPFATCLYSARVAAAAADPVNLSGGGGNNGGVFEMPPNSVYNAPQFEGHLPDEIPEHLEDGCTVYFYGDVTITPPANSLIYSDGATNFYADGGRETVSDGHVMCPAAPNGNIMGQQPITVNEQALFNFDDGGIIVLPAGYTGVINGQQVKGGDAIVINHADDLLVPPGTKLYPFPMGSNTDGAHADDPNHQPYDGPPIQMPNNPAATANNANQPGTDVWWEAP